MSTTKAMRKLFKQRGHQMSDAVGQAIRDNEKNDPIATPPKINKNTLSDQQKFKVASWIQTHSKMLLGDNSWTLDKIAERASRELGFIIKGSNIKNGFKMVGLPIPRKVASKAKVKQAIGIIAKALYDSLKRRGEYVPPELELLVKDLEK